MSGADTVIPVIEESLSIDKRELVTGHARVETVTDIVEQSISTDLDFTTVDIRRVPVGRPIDAVPDVRVEGELTIVPVVEEVVVVEKRLVLKEEIHITRHHGTTSVNTPVSLRKQRALVTRAGEAPSDPRSNLKETSMTEYTENRRLSAFFDSRADAEEAAARLRALGIEDANLRITGGEEATTRVENREPGGFWDSIADFFFPNEDRETYAEGIRRGGYLLTVSGVPAERFDEAVDILDDEGSVDLEERSQSWRAEGWQGASVEDSALTGAATGMGTAATGYGVTAADSAYGAADTDATYGSEAGTGREATAFDTAAAGLGRSVGEDETIPVIEERLRVGKRDTSLGRVRVRSYVVEEPFSEDVSLHSERVEIERRPVDRALGAGEEAFVDRTIEAEERAEEAVIQKEARVTEEIGLRKSGEDRTETVSDTVRHTEVEIEDERGTLTDEERLRKDDPRVRGA